MNDKDKQYLTEWGGECWHKPKYQEDVPIPHWWCSKCELIQGVLTENKKIINRTFTTPDDAAWVKEKLMEKMEWEGESGFMWWVFLRVERTPPIEEINDFGNILTDPPIFCEKVVEFLKEKKDDKI